MPKITTSLSKKTKLYPIQSPQQLLTVTPLRLLSTKMGDVKSHIVGSNHNKEEHTTDPLYFGRTENVSIYYVVFKPSIKEAVSINRITI